VRPGVVSDYPARMVDIAPTIAALLGLPPLPSDGVVLADSLQQPPEGSESAQHTASSRLSFYVSALRKRLQAAGR
jgi:arylsulfatase A-like enzyme